MTVGLPFGRRRAKFDDGKTFIEFQNTVRKQRNAEIIRMYDKYLEDNMLHNMKMSPSTYWRILDTCLASRRKSLHCVDYFIVDAAEVILS